MLKRPAGRGAIGMLLISPTRELAMQIAEEAKMLAAPHKFAVQVHANLSLLTWLESGMVLAYFQKCGLYLAFVLVCQMNVYVGIIWN